MTFPSPPTNLRIPYPTSTLCSLYVRRDTLVRVVHRALAAAGRRGELVEGAVREIVLERVLSHPLAPFQGQFALRGDRVVMEGRGVCVMQQQQQQVAASAEQERISDRYQQCSYNCR